MQDNNTAKRLRIASAKEKNSFKLSKKLLDFFD